MSGFLDLWTHWLVSQRSIWVVLAFTVMLVLIGRMPQGQRPKVRIHTTLVVAHLLTLMLAAAMVTLGYRPRPYLVAAFAFELFAFVGIASTSAFRVILPRLGIQLPRILIDIVSGVAVIVAMIAVGTRAGFSVTGLITTSAVLTAVIGFALQDTLGNMMGGIALQLDRSINVGDWISLGQGTPPGRVTEIRWRYTAIETTAWTTIIIPNSTLMKGQVTVLGRRQGEPVQWRREVDFHVDFRHAPAEVTAAVRSALNASPVERTATEPPVQVLFFGLRDSFGWYRVRYWLADLATDEVTDNEVRTRVYYALRRAGMSFSIPAHTIFMTNRDEDQERRIDRDLERRLDAIAKVDVLASLGEQERARVATGLRFAPFTRGEAMTREGDRDDGLYMIVDGEASVQIGKGPTAREVARLGPGKFFGEMSLMTGEKRSATVIAATDCITYRLEKPAFEALIRSRPELADAVAEVLAERRMHLDAARESAADDASRSRKRQSTKNDILGRIRGFFNLSGSGGNGSSS